MDSTPKFSQEAQLFLAECIQSAEDLEVLFLLRANSTKEWSAAEVQEHLRIEIIAAGKRLFSLHMNGLLAHPRSAGPLYRYRYHPVSEVLEKATEEIAKAYSDYRDAVVNYLENLSRTAMASEVPQIKR